MLLVNKFSLVSPTLQRELMTQYSNKKRHLLQNAMTYRRQSLKSANLEEGGRAWRKHTGKNKQRKRRDLVHKKVGSNPSFTAFFNKNLLNSYFSGSVHTRLQTVEKWLTRSQCQCCFPNREEKMNSGTMPSRKSL